MTKPVTIPNAFAAQTGPIPLSQLDTNFNNLALSVNDFGTYGNFLVDTGAVNTIVVASAAGTTVAYAAGLPLQIKLAVTNTATAVTVNVNGMGAQTLLNNDGTAPAIGQLVAGMILDMVYNGTAFLLTGAASKGAVTGGGTVTSVQLTSSGGTITITGTNPITTSGTINIEAVTAGTGTVTSVGLSSTDLTITGTNPVTSSGTITPNLATQAGLTAGSYTSTNLTVNSKGIITAASNGSGGGSTTGTFTATTTGLTAATMPCSWTLVGNSVTLSIGQASGTTGTGTAFTITNLPAAIQPVTPKFAAAAAIGQNAGVFSTNINAFISGAVVNFFIGAAAFGWTAGTRSVGVPGTGGVTFVWEIT